MSVTRGLYSQLLAGTVPSEPRSAAKAPRARKVLPGMGDCAVEWCYDDRERLQRLLSSQAKQSHFGRWGDTASNNPRSQLVRHRPAGARHFRRALENRTVSRLPVGAKPAAGSAANIVSYDGSLGIPKQPQPAASRPHVWRSRRRP